MHHAAIRKFNKDTLFFILNGCFLGLLTLIVLYPLYFVVIASISDPDAVLAGKVILYPVQITLDGFRKILERQDIWRGYLNTIIYTLMTVVLALGVTIPAGWALSRKDLPGRKWWNLPHKASVPTSFLPTRPAADALNIFCRHFWRCSPKKLCISPAIPKPRHATSKCSLPCTASRPSSPLICFRKQSIVRISQCWFVNKISDP